MTNGEHWTVGALTEATGLTARTLHHYEELGLLAPGRTSGNHRVYDEVQVQRLYRICALRELDLSLSEIQGAFADESDVHSVLMRHLAETEEEIARLERLRDRLASLCRKPDVTPPDLLATIEAMARLGRVAVGTSSDAAARWRTVGDELRACMVAGEAVDGAAVRPIVRRIRDDLQRFAGGDQATLNALTRVRRHAPPSNLAGWTPALFAYLDAALRALEEE